MPWKPPKFSLNPNENSSNKNTKTSLPEIKIELLNIQGLTRAKILEIEPLINVNVTYCLPETQQNWDTMQLSNPLNSITSMKEPH